MITPDVLNMINLLPGLYAARDQLSDQIATIETTILNGTGEAKRGRPRKIPAGIRALAVQPNGGQPQASKKTMKSIWDRMTPQQRARRIRRMKAGREQAARTRKRAEKQAQAA